MFFTCDVGGTNLRTGVVDINGIILHRTKYPTPKNYEQLLKLVKTEFFRMSEQFPVSECCISVAGAVFDDGTVWLPNVFGSNRFNISYDLRSVLQKKKIFVIDDRVAGLLGELWKGCAIGKKDVLYLVIGTGVGLGILSNGTLVAGNQGLAGSVGWIKIHDPLTSSVESIENLIAGPAIVKRYKEICKAQASSAQDVFSLYLSKDDCAEKVILIAAQSIGHLLSIITNTFNPEIIILAGSLALQWHIMKEHALRVLQEQISPFIQKPQIQSSFLGENAQLLGCAKYILISQERGDRVVSI